MSEWSSIVVYYITIDTETSSSVNISWDFFAATGCATSILASGFNILFPSNDRKMSINICKLLNGN